MRRFLAAAVLVLLLAVPAADALNVAARGIQARPSDLYSSDTAWGMGYYGCNVTVAIFDEGVDDGHPYLDGKVVAGVDTTDTSVFWTQANGGNPQPVVGSHGTPVAGIVASHAGQPFNTPEDAPNWADDDLVGVAPCAWMVDVQFNDITGATEGEMVAAFDWAIEHKDDDWGDDDPTNDGIEIITMSWSPNDQTDGSDPVCEAANRAVAAGIVVLGSAGNSGSLEEPDLGCPTGADGALSIANIWNHRTVTRDDDEIEESSTWGPRTDDGDDDLYEELKPDLAAPGTSVRSTGAALADGSEYAVVCFGPGDIPVSTGYDCETSFGGTSGATPVIAGTVALMLQANPGLSPAEVEAILHQTAVPLPDVEPSAANLSAKWHHQHGRGLVDAHAAVVMALQWPGMELGRDTDEDGVRDWLDAAPFDPNDATVVVPDEPPEPSPSDPATSATPSASPTGQRDVDGDGLPDDEDPAPNDPLNRESDDEAPRETPALAPLAVLLLLAGIAVARRH